jgi:hypothetical protein
MQCNKSKKKIEIKKILTYIEYRTEGKDAYMELSHNKKKTNGGTKRARSAVRSWSKSVLVI